MIKSAAQSSLLNDTRYTSMSAGVVPSSEYLISTTVLDTAVSNVTFDVSSFVGVYKHLKIVAVVRASAAADRVNGSWRMNGDEGNNYAAHHMIGTQSSIATSALTSQNRANRAMGDATVPGAGAASNVFGAIVVDFLDPFSTTKYKTSRTFSGQANSSNPRVGFCSGLWMSTLPATSIILLADDSGGGYNWVAGSRFSLYGVTA